MAILFKNDDIMILTIIELNGGNNMNDNQVVSNVEGNSIQIPEFLLRQRTQKEELVIGILKVSALLLVGFVIGVFVGRI